MKKKGSALIFGHFLGGTPPKNAGFWGFSEILAKIMFFQTYHSSIMAYDDDVKDKLVTEGTKIIDDIEDFICSLCLFEVSDIEL